jgi:hypothetical protein
VIVVTIVATAGSRFAAANSRSACVPQQQPATIKGSPAASLLSILGVLRRPGTPADALPPQLRLFFSGTSFFVDYVRRARVVSGRSYYVVPARFGRCGTTLEPHEGIVLVCVLRANQRILDAGTGGESTATQVKQDGMFLVGGSCLHTSRATLLAGVVPDGVAAVTLHYPASTLTITPVDNIVAAAVPDPGGPLWRPLAMVWRSADGAIIKTIHGRL